MRRIAAALLLAGFASMAPDAGAAVVTIEVREREGYPRGGVERRAYVEVVDYAGEANRIVVSESNTAVEVRDEAAPLTAGAGCTASSKRIVRCESPVFDTPSVSIESGDGDDHLDGRSFGQGLELLGGSGADRLIAGPASGSSLDGGPGDDHLLGSEYTDLLHGGAGSDVLVGGVGDDLLRPDEGDADTAPDTVDGGPGQDRVSYVGRTTPVWVDLADPSPDGAPGERDDLTSVEGILGGSGRDRLAGDGGSNELHGGIEADDAGDVLEGRGGKDDLIGGAGADTMSGGPGVDRLEDGNDGDRLEGGPGDDHIDPRFDRTPPPGDLVSTLRCGSGRDLVNQPEPRSLVSRDCERVAMQYVDVMLVAVDRRRRLLHLGFRRGSLLQDPLPCWVRARAGGGWAHGLSSRLLTVGYRPRRRGAAAVRFEVMPSCRRKRFEPQLTVLFGLDAGR